MCARLLACPLCSQPGFLSLDALRTGLVSVATRPLACPVCNEVLLGIDKLTIHLFGHTINSNVSQNNVQIHHELQAIPIQTWNILKEVGEKDAFSNQEQESYILKESQILQNNENRKEQVIFLQSADQLFTASLIQDDGLRNDLNSEMEKDNFNHQEKQIGNHENGSLLENNSLDQNLISSSLDLLSEGSNLIQNDSSLMQNDSNLIQNDSSLMQNDSNLIQNDSSLMQNDSNLIHNNSNLILDSNLLQNNVSLSQDLTLIQNDVGLNQSGLNLLQSNSSLITSNDMQSNSNLIKDSLDLIQNNSDIIQNSSDLIQNGSELIQNSSDLIQNGSELIQNSSDLIQNGSDMIQNGSELIQNSSDLIQNGSDLIQNGSDLIQNTSSLLHNNEIQNNSNLMQTDSNLSENNTIQNNAIQNTIQSTIQNTIQNSWNLNTPSVIIIKETNGKSEKKRAETLNDENGLDDEDISDGEIEITAIGHETVKKRKDGALPYLKNFKLLTSKEKTERCNICGYRCDDRKILILHKQLVHMIAEKDLNVKPEDLLKNYPCHLCTKVFKMKGSLMVHMRVAHTNYISGSTPSELELSPSSENGYNCPICAKNFRKEQHVTQHLRTHEGKQWECDVCSKMFTTKYFLKKHKRLHSGEMPYKCNICDKTFTFQQSYHKHRLYHKDDKPHSCATCGRSFKELSTLHNHERIHTGEKPFACETCGKCFRQRVSYLVHRRIHTGVMPYKCTSCGKNFRYKVSQRTHKCQTVEAQNSAILLQRLLQISEKKETRSETTAQPEKCSERNKFILSMNEDGEPILTRESDLKAAEAAKKNANLQAQENSEKEAESIWIEDDENFREPSVSEKERTDIEKLHLDVPPDLFSMMMLSEDKDLPTPSSEMEHLRLSSPIQKENEIGVNLSESPNELEMMGLTRSNVVENFGENDSLRTIDDASLNELIYGISQG